MKIVPSIALAVLLTGLSTVNAAEPKRELDSIDYAYFVCKVFNSYPQTTDCKVRGGNFSVDVTMDATGSQARKVCADASAEMAKMTRVFKGEWKLRILSPYSGDKAIASCTLY